MKVEFNIENIKLLITEVLGMKISDKSVSDNIEAEFFTYYKKCHRSEFGLVREYYLTVYIKGDQIWVNRLKIVNTQRKIHNKRSYKNGLEDNWWVLLRDLSNRTFSLSDSFDIEYMKDMLKIALRNKEIDNLIN